MMLMKMILDESDFASNIERFTGFAELYDKYRPQPPTILHDLLTQLANVVMPKLVVDLGCGTGLSTRFWSARAEQVIGIDPTDDMRRVAELQNTFSNVSFQKALSHQTGLPDDCADLVTCSQSLHWMDPLPTFQEAARILRNGGVFAAYDCDWPPTTTRWEADAAYNRCMERVKNLGDKLGVDEGLKFWSKEGHLGRMKASGCFRFTKEVVVHHVEEGNAERLIGLAQSQGNVIPLFKKGLSETEIGWNEIRKIATETLGESLAPWYFSYRVRLGIV
jgi:ubiquinone/menaquinone biosynthesis C-methylase UbiE